MTTTPYREGDVARAMADELRKKLEAAEKRADAAERALQAGANRYNALVESRHKGGRALIFVTDALLLLSGTAASLTGAVAAYADDDVRRAGAYGAAFVASYALARRRLTGRWL